MVKIHSAVFICKAGQAEQTFLPVPGVTLAVTYPSISSIFFHKLPIVVIVEGGVAIDPLLLAQVMILSFGTVHCSVGDLKHKRSH